MTTTMAPPPPTRTRTTERGRVAFLLLILVLGFALGGVADMAWDRWTEAQCWQAEASSLRAEMTTTREC